MSQYTRFCVKGESSAKRRDSRPRNTCPPWLLSRAGEPFIKDPRTRGGNTKPCVLAPSRLRFTLKAGTNSQSSVRVRVRVRVVVHSEEALRPLRLFRGRGPRHLRPCGTCGAQPPASGPRPVPWLHGTVLEYRSSPPLPRRRFFLKLVTIAGPAVVLRL